MTSSTSKLFIVLAFPFFSASSSAQTPGSLDMSFNGTGTMTLQPGTLHDVVYGLAVQPDSMIVFCGVARITATSGFTSDLVVGRLYPDGSLDAAFGDNGYFNLPGLQGSAYGYGIGLQSDGKIVVCGGYSITASDFDIIVVRLNTDGTLDPTFGGGAGFSLIPVASSEDFAYDLHILDDGRIILAGSSKVPGFSMKRGVVLRLEPNGALDTSFGTQGITLFQIDSGTSETFKCMDLTPGGAIIAAGYSYQSNAEHFVMAGFTSEGSLNTSFGTNGHYFGTMTYAYDLIVKGNTVYAGGKLESLEGNDVAIMSFDTVGVVHSQWGVSGMTTTDINASDVGLAMALQPDGKILAGGTSGAAGAFGDRDFVALRYDQDGLLDPTFGTMGYAIHPVGGSFDEANALVLQPDGKILLGGFGALGNNDMVIMRLNNEIATVVQTSPDNLPGWRAFPVPLSGDELFFSGTRPSDAPVHITIRDSKGRQLATSNEPGGHDQQTIRVELPSGMDAGLYVAEIRSAGYMTYLKFIRY